jgi:uncharacterized protein YhhL (DUF1145 family)
MKHLLMLAKLLILIGVLLAIFAVFYTGPYPLTLFLSVGQVSLIVGIMIYLGVVIRDLKEKRVL